MGLGIDIRGSQREHGLHRINAGSGVATAGVDSDGQSDDCRVGIRRKNVGIQNALDLNLVGSQGLAAERVAIDFWQLTAF